MGDASVERPARDGRARRWAGQRAKRRQEIIVAALAAVAEHGPATTAEQIAASAGLPRPQLYRYFDDADELHDAVVTRVGERVTEIVSGTFAHPVGSPAGLIHAAVDAFVGWLAEHPNLYRYVLVRSPGGVVVSKARVGRRIGALLAVYAGRYRVDAALVDPCAFALVGMVESATARWLDDPGALCRAELVEQLSRWCWNIIDDVLRANGVVVDPHEELPLPAGSL